MKEMRKVLEAFSEEVACRKAVTNNKPRDYLVWHLN